MVQLDNTDDSVSTTMEEAFQGVETSSIIILSDDATVEIVKVDEHIETVKNEEVERLCEDIEPICPYCLSDKVYGISRVVGYFSIIENWNVSKQKEFKARQKGKYWHDE
jgi:anaerobic ribonucleoside-triphosphate reductase